MRNTSVAVVIAVLGAGVAAGQEASKTAPAPPAAAVKATFAGTETCEICHEDTVKAFGRNPHHSLETDKHKGTAGHACETCHGAGSAHAESADAALIRNPAKLAPAAIDKICLDCHLNQPTHVGRLESSHARDQVPCTACHKIHSDEVVARTAAKINTQCANCHTNEWAEFQRPAHHKLPEGAMSCVDCHNPHGSVQLMGGRPAMAQSFGANEPGCLNCHGDKRGPFTFEHQPVRFEGCTACHEPHGSANPRMLTRQDVRYVCLECHANTPTPRTPSSPANRTIGVTPPSFHDLRLPQYQNCTVCHQKVHGSYVDRDLLK